MKASAGLVSIGTYGFCYPMITRCEIVDVGQIAYTKRCVQPRCRFALSFDGCFQVLYTPSSASATGSPRIRVRWSIVARIQRMGHLASAYPVRLLVFVWLPGTGTGCVMYKQAKYTQVRVEMQRLRIAWPGPRLFGGLGLLASSGLAVCWNVMRFREYI